MTAVIVGAGGSASTDGGLAALTALNPRRRVHAGVELVVACVTYHLDPESLVIELAHLLRDSGPLLDGGLPPVAAYEPAARARHSGSTISSAHSGTPTSAAKPT